MYPGPETIWGKFFGIIATYIGALIITYIANKAGKILFRKKYNMKETAIRSFISVSLWSFIIIWLIKMITHNFLSNSIIYALYDFAIIYVPCLIFYLIIDIKKAKIEEPDISKISI